MRAGQDQVKYINCKSAADSFCRYMIHILVLHIELIKIITFIIVEGSDGSTARKSGQTQGKSSTNGSSHNAKYDSYYGSDDEDEEKRRKKILSHCAADLPRPRRQRRPSRLRK